MSLRPQKFHSCIVYWIVSLGPVEVAHFISPRAYHSSSAVWAPYCRSNPPACIGSNQGSLPICAGLETASNKRILIIYTLYYIVLPLCGRTDCISYILIHVYHMKEIEWSSKIQQICHSRPLSHFQSALEKRGEEARADSCQRKTLILQRRMLMPSHPSQIGHMASSWNNMKHLCLIRAHQDMLDIVERLWQILTAWQLHRDWVPYRWLNVIEIIQGCRSPTAAWLPNGLEIAPLGFPHELLDSLNACPRNTKEK